MQLNEFEPNPITTAMASTYVRFSLATTWCLFLLAWSQLVSVHFVPPFMTIVNTCMLVVWIVISIGAVVHLSNNEFDKIYPSTGTPAYLAWRDDAKSVWVDVALPYTTCSVVLMVLEGLPLLFIVMAVITTQWEAFIDWVLAATRIPQEEQVKTTPLPWVRNTMKTKRRHSDYTNLEQQVALATTSTHMEQTKATFDPTFNDIVDKQYQTVHNNQLRHDRKQAATREAQRRQMQAQAQLAKQLRYN
jgi:hypothetical protein